MKVLNVAEKPTVAKEISIQLSNGGQSSRAGISKFNRVFEFPYNINGKNVNMAVTSVLGHLMEVDFPPPYNKAWQSIEPGALFDMEVKKDVAKDKGDIKKNLETEISGANWLILWLDCDREDYPIGENIAFEVIEVCRNIKPNIQISRARFADVNRASIERAIQNLELPNRFDSMAVDTRQELDLRLGAIFTRFQSLQLQPKFPELKGKTLSYGPCQFPTLGFVVDRYWRVKAFVPEKFWYLQVMLEKDGERCELSWSRHRLFDRPSCAVLYEMALENPMATVTSMQTKPTTKWRPFPLSTVELQKKAAKSLHISAQRTMTIAEALYTKGYISYPRTETEAFSEGTDLMGLIAHQVNHHAIGAYAQRLQNGGFRQPKRGKGDDKSHPPIHPTKPGNDLEGDDARVYEFIARHFLACCSEDAKGMETTATFQIGVEIFTATGVMILERNFLDVYPYIKWDSKTIPKFVQGEQIVPKEFTMSEGSTTAPDYLSEEELVTLMDKNGIGTDATIAEHIHKVIDRGYVFEENRKLKPTTLGEALVAGYNAIQLQTLSKSELRAKTEADVKLIAEQRKQKDEVLRESIEAYRAIYHHMVANVGTLVKALSRYFQFDPNFGGGGGGGGDAGVPVLRCPECSVNMLLKSRGEKGGQLIGCADRNCRKVLWLPREMKLTVTDEVCAECTAKRNCGPIHKLDVVVDRAAIPPNYPHQWRGCIGGCDEIMLELIRNSTSSFGSNWFQKGSIPPPNPNAVNRSSTNSRGSFQQNRNSSNQPTFNAMNQMAASVTTSWDGSVVPQTPAHVARNTYNNNNTNSNNFHNNSNFGGARNNTNNFNNSRNNTNNNRSNSRQNQHDDDEGGGDDDDMDDDNGFGGENEMNGRNRAGSNADDGTVKCLCDMVTTKRPVRKEGANQGREFYGCARNPKTCDFFMWADGANSGGRGGGGGYGGGNYGGYSGGGAGGYGGGGGWSSGKKRGSGGGGRGTKRGRGTGRKSSGRPAKKAKKE